MKKLSLLLTLLVMTTLGASAYTSNLYIWGQQNGWSNTDATYTLTSISDGVYEGTFTIGPGEFKFGATLGDWSLSYGGAGTISQTDHEYSGLSSSGGNMTFSLPQAEYKFHVDLTTGKLIVTAAGAVTYPAQVYLRGSMNGWGSTAVAGQDGIYTYTFANLDGASATEFKFALSQDSWDYGSDWGELTEDKVGEPQTITGGSNFIIPAGQTGNWTVTLDLSQSTITFQGTWTDPEPGKEYVYLHGSFNGWGAATAVEGQDGIFSYTFEDLDGESATEFKFTSTSGWDGTQWGSNWGALTADKVGEPQVAAQSNNDNFIIPAGQTGDWTVTLNTNNNTILFEGTWVEPQPVEEKTFIKGSFDGWTLHEMTKDANGKYVFTQAMDANVQFGFEDENGTWIGADGSGMFEVTREQVVNGTELSVLSGAGVNFTIPVAGTWTLTLDRETMKLVISGEWPEPVVETNYFLAYGPKLNDGEESDAWTMVELVENNGIYSVAQNTAVYYNDTPRSFMFKIVKQTTGNEAVWYGSNTELSSEVLSLQLSDSGADIEIPAFTRGDWTFSFNPETEYLTLAGTWTNPVTYAYLYGIGGDWSTPVELTLSDGVYQKAETITDVDGQGYGYVKVQVMTDYVDNQWYQFLGPESEGDFLITAATANTDIPLPYSSSDMGDVEAFQVPAGDYTISVDVYNSTVRFAGNVIDKQTLSDVLGGANDGDEVALSESLKVLYVDEQGTAFATNGNGQWIALAGGDFVKDNAYKNIQGILGSKATEPTITVSASALDEAAQIETEIPVIDLTADEDFEVFAAEVTTFKGYYSAGTGCLSQWKNSKGNSLKLEGADIEDGKFMAVTVALKKNAAAGAPRRAPGDSENKLEGFTGSVLESESLDPTAVDTINAGQAVVSVRYYNVAGAQSSKPFSGMNIVVTKFADGTVKTAKVVK